MKKHNLSIFTFFILQLFYGQIGIGTANPNSSSILDINSTNGGVLVPRMTQAQKNTIASPATGLLIYQTDGSTGFWYYNGTAWTTFTSSGWSTTGTAGTNFIGTTDNSDFILTTNNTERIRFQGDGDVGINQNNPTSKLHITGTAPILRLEDGNQATNKILISDNNGNATWGPSSLITTDLNDDWLFSTTNKTYSGVIFHQGKIVIGRTGTTTHLADIDNGLDTGTSIGVGDNLYIRDGNGETQFSHGICPENGLQQSYNLGRIVNSGTFKWRNFYATNGSVQTSDIREKTNIKPISYGLKELM